MLLVAALALPAAAQAAPRGTLEVTHQLASPAEPQAAVPVLHVRKGRRIVHERQLTGPLDVRLSLRAGRYRVASTARCSRRLRVFAGETTTAQVVTRPGRGCRVRIHHPAAFPAASRVRAAQRFVRRRGLASFAVIDSHGRLRGAAPRRRYISASVVKAMLLVAYLRQIGNRLPSAAERAALGPMITVSDNDMADSIYARVGDARLLTLARRAGMRDLTVAGHWGSVFFSAADQARFFLRFDSLVPRASRAYARRLLSSIAPYQRWGFSRYAQRRGWSTFFKGGWRRTDRGSLVHEAALFERGGRRFSLAVLTEGNPSHAYGTATLRGVAKRLFGARGRASQRDEAGSGATRRAGLVDIHRYAPGIRVDLVYRGRRNLTGRRLPGYCREWALLQRPAARDLARVQRWLRRRGRGLLVLDAYRPARASRALVRWAERSGRGHLVGTYIARRSRHNTGSAVDLTLVRASDGKRLRMGSGFDDLSARAHTRNASGRALRNRLTLERAMERFGFTNYWREWWHFEHRVGANRHLDLSLGC